MGTLGAVTLIIFLSTLAGWALYRAMIS